MKVILITGAAGFVGSHLTERCLNAGYRVIAVDDMSQGMTINLNKCRKQKEFHFIKADLTEASTVGKISEVFSKLKIKKIEAIIHLAAKKIPRYGGRNKTIAANFNTTQTVCEVGSKFKSKIVFASTSDVYGLTKDFPFKEDGAVVFGPSYVGRWSYGASKYLSEQLLWGYHEDFDLPIVILRIFGVYGPRMVKGWKGNAVSAFFEQSVGGKKIDLHGTGEQTRSFVFIEDLIEGILKAIKLKSAENRIINIGSREVISMKELAGKIFRLVNHDKRAKYKYVSYKSFTGREYQDIMAKLPDLKTAKKYLNWSPRTVLDDGLKETFDWYLSCR